MIASSTPPTAVRFRAATSPASHPRDRRLAMDTAGASERPTRPSYELTPSLDTPDGRC